MKSIKPGRGPSGMGAIGSVAAGLFGVIWTIGAVNMGAPIFFVFFGIVFIGIAIIQAIYHLKNATGKNRMSVFDITEDHEEPDPLDSYIKRSTRRGNQITENHPNSEITMDYCPFCGNKVIVETYRYCPKCGKEIRN